MKGVELEPEPGLTIVATDLDVVGKDRDLTGSGNGPFE
jgi:hypothetical protein